MAIGWTSKQQHFLAHRLGGLFARCAQVFLREGISVRMYRFASLETDCDDRNIDWRGNALKWADLDCAFYARL